MKKYAEKLKFNLKLDPVIDSSAKYRSFIPEPFKTVVLISADFELGWAWRYSKSAHAPLEKAIAKANLERDNIAPILGICENHDIPITFLTVGHLLLHDCKSSDGKPHSNMPRIANFENKFWNFKGTDWYEYDPCTNSEKDPQWYAPDLIRQIMQSRVAHEIGCHTFSHIDCRDEICPPQLMRAELDECKKLAEAWDLQLTSFVHPGHTIGNLDVLAEEGFTNFRSDYRNVLGYPKQHGNGLWEYEQTTEFAFHKDWSIDYHIYRYIEIIKRAMQSNTVCVFWFHPSFDSIVIEEILPKVFQYLDTHREDIWITTHGEYAEWLNSVKP